MVLSDKVRAECERLGISWRFLENFGIDGIVLALLSKIEEERKLSSDLRNKIMEIEQPSYWKKKYDELNSLVGWAENPDRMGS